MDDSFRTSFGVAISRQRESLGMLQRDLAAKTNIDQGTLSRIESGKARCDVARGRRIAKALQTTLPGLSALAEQIEISRSATPPNG